jgi:hypothetical protein
MCCIGTRVIRGPDSRPLQRKSIVIKTQACTSEPLAGSFTEVCRDRFLLATQDAAKTAGREDAKQKKNMRQPERADVGRIAVERNSQKPTR